MPVMNRIAARGMTFTILAATVGFWCQSATAQIDLSRANVIVPDGLSGPEHKAVRLLVEEVRKRSQIAWDVLIRWPQEVAPVIVVSPARLAETVPGPFRQQVLALATGKEPEGFRIETLESDTGAALGRGRG